MSDYISREAAISEFETCGSVFVYGEKVCKAIVGRLNIIPAADVVTWEQLKKAWAIATADDVVEVRRGKWIDGLDVPKEERERHPYVYLHGEKHCSVCFKEAYFDTDYGQQLFDYCPNCGAKMDL